MASSLETPPLVLRARAERLPHGPLLHVLAAQRGRARVGVAGGAAAAWVVSALPPHVPVLVVEADAAVRSLYAADEQVHVSEADASALEAEAPFDLLVLARPAEAELVVRLLAPGGTVVAPPPLAHPALVTADVVTGLVLGARAL